MKVAVVGTGNIGGTLARKLVAAGHIVSVANSEGRESLEQFATEIGAVAANIDDVATGADAVILAIPSNAIATLSRDFLDSISPEATVIDTSNYYPGLRDSRIPEIDAGMTESVWVSSQLGVPVVKAFNNALAYTLANLGLPTGKPGRLAIAVAGDVAEKKEIAMTLVNHVGFDPVDAGSLEESWRQQPSTPAYCCDYDAETMRAALLAAIKGAAESPRVH
ncbi:NAD(P)-binding domain-containing protein [Duganella sp. BJB1802]|uniref:NADPH-dependent F420 reductase n=1 Tax=Duganella sp. BJB1802 TaxID=2744575 RepID=UPI0015942CA8|nr:NAD(P)-binding domain-containing protein [Duganella sp. BJB1802]NVD74070.1 NAD(P)-binding domain-containing protein [Duganella sp. BJB1802]